MSIKTLNLKNTLVFCILFLSLSLLGQVDNTEDPKYSDSISVYIFLLDECKICSYYMPTLREIYQDYSDNQIQFIGLFPNFSSKKAAIEDFKALHKLDFSLKTDYFKTKAKLFDATVLPEVVVYDEKNKMILYKGRIDNSYVAIGRQRRVVNSHELKTVLEHIKKNQAINVDNQPAIGCFINFADSTSKY